MTRLAGLTALVVLVPLAGHAETWHCRNLAVEVSCGAGSCDVSEAHTPMDVSVTGSGEMALCAYTGCWKGQAASVLSLENFLIVTGLNLAWSHDSDRRTSGTVTVDRDRTTATVMVSGFALPMTCAND